MYYLDEPLSATCKPWAAWLKFPYGPLFKRRASFGWLAFDPREERMKSLKSIHRQRLNCEWTEKKVEGFKVEWDGTSYMVPL